MSKRISGWATGLAFLIVIAFSIADAGARAGRAGGGGRGHAAGTRSHVGSSSFHRGSRVGVFVGAPIIVGPRWHHPGYHYGYDPYFFPPVTYMQQEGVVYAEQPPQGSAPAAAVAADPYRYYCEDSKTYYPYVQNCATPWQRVMPHAPQ